MIGKRFVMKHSAVINSRNHNTDMGLFGNNALSLQKRISELELSLDEANVQLARLQEESSDYQQTIATFHLSTERYDKEKDVIKTKYEKQVGDLKVQLKDTETSLNKRLNQTLQTMGVNNTFLNEVPVEMDNSPQALFKQFDAMPIGIAKQEFYKKHETAIRKASGL